MSQQFDEICEKWLAYVMETHGCNMSLDEFKEEATSVSIFGWDDIELTLGVDGVNTLEAMNAAEEVDPLAFACCEGGVDIQQVLHIYFNLVYDIDGWYEREGYGAVSGGAPQGEGGFDILASPKATAC